MPRWPNQKVSVDEPTKMTEAESAELDEMLDQPVAVTTVPTSADACEFCGAEPKVPVKGFDCQCMRRQTAEGKAASLAAKAKG